MADIESYADVRDLVPNLGGKLVKVEFEKEGATDVIILPDYLGSEVVWCNVVKKSTGELDDATDIDGLEVTLSTGTGTMVGLFLVE